MPTINPLVNLITYSIIEGSTTIKQAVDYAIKCKLDDNEIVTPLTIFDLKSIQTALGNWLELECGNEDDAETEHPHIFGMFEYIGTLLNGLASVNDINEFLLYLNWKD